MRVRIRGGVRQVLQAIGYGDARERVRQRRGIGCGADAQSLPRSRSLPLLCSRPPAGLPLTKEEDARRVGGHCSAQVRRQVPRLAGEGRRGPQGRGRRRRTWHRCPRVHALAAQLAVGTCQGSTRAQGRQRGSSGQGGDAALKRTRALRKAASRAGPLFPGVQAEGRDRAQKAACPAHLTCQQSAKARPHALTCISVGLEGSAGNARAAAARQLCLAKFGACRQVWHYSIVGARARRAASQGRAGRVRHHNLLQLPAGHASQQPARACKDGTVS